MKNATPTETANYITNTGCKKEAQFPGDNWWIEDIGSITALINRGYQIRIALTPFGLPSHLEPHNPAGLSAEKITEGGYRAVTVGDRGDVPNQMWCEGNEEWRDAMVATPGWTFCAGAISTYRLPADTTFPDWEEMSKAKEGVTSWHPAVAFDESFHIGPPQIDGGRWHRPHFTPDMLAGGWRPLLDGEPCQTGDEVLVDGKWVDGVDEGFRMTSRHAPTRTRRPMPEMSKATVKESLTPPPAPGETPEEKTCGELSCDECNDRYSRIRDQRDNLLKMLEAAEAELTTANADRVRLREALKSLHARAEDIYSQSDEYSPSLYKAIEKAEQALSTPPSPVKH